MNIYLRAWPRPREQIRPPHRRRRGPSLERWCDVPPALRPVPARGNYQPAKAEMLTVLRSSSCTCESLLKHCKRVIVNRNPLFDFKTYQISARFAALCALANPLSTRASEAYDGRIRTPNQNSVDHNVPEAAMKLIRFAALYLLAALVALPFVDGLRTSAAPPVSKFVLVAHCGAGDYSKAPPAYIQSRREALADAIKQGYKILAAGGTSLDAVETTIRSMEDSGQFDAGRGAYYTRAGVPEMDAAIMDGNTLAAGSVAALQHIANPIHLARLVMEKTPHVMLVGTGAERFAESQGIDLVSPYYFYNERLWQQYQRAKEKDAEDKKKSSALPAAPITEYGTVGVVALDQHGNLAAGTSTGGTTYKMPGRVGDSPIIGAGTYANNESCGVSGTGVGEFFMRNIVAADICERVRYLHVPLEQAANDVVMRELVEQNGEGGVIALDHQGNVATAFNTTGMITGTVRPDGKIEMKGWSKTAEPIFVPATQ